MVGQKQEETTQMIFIVICLFACFVWCFGNIDRFLKLYLISPLYFEGKETVGFNV